MLRSISLMLLAAFAVPAMAGDLSYSYVEGGYQRVELDDSSGLNVDGDSYGIGGSMEIGDSFHVFGDVAKSKFDYSADLDQYSLGVGYHTSMTDSVDAIFELAYVHAEADVFGFSAKDDGYGASIGVRAMLGNQFELGGSVNYVDLGGGSDDTTVDGSVRYYVTPAIALGINAGIGNDVTSYGAGLQVYFGR